MARKILGYTTSADIHSFDILPRMIRCSPEDVDLSAPLTKYSEREKPRYRITRAVLSAPMQCISGTPENTKPNLAFYRLTGVAGVVTCNQPVEKQAAVVRKLKEEGVQIIPFSINTHDNDYKKRFPALLEAGGNLVVVDASQGMSPYQKKAVQFCRSEAPEMPVIGGNIATAEGFYFLVNDCGVDAVKAGYSSGFGCITARTLGLGRRQPDNLKDVSTARKRHHKKTGVYVPIISDGGAWVFSDITKAFAFGADAVMVGRMPAGCPETPNPIYNSRFYRDGRVVYEGPAKEFWYEASRRARLLAGGEKIRDYSYRYEEGREGWVKLADPVEDFFGTGFEIVRDGIRKAGCVSVNDMHKNADAVYSGRTLDTNDPEIALWDHRNVEVEIEGTWLKADSPVAQEYLLAHSLGGK